MMEWLRDHGWESWLVLAVVLGGLEMLGLELFLVMLAGGALVGALTAALGGPLALQLGLALVTSVALLGLVTRRLSLRSHIAFGPFIVVGALAALLVRFTVV